MTEEGNSTPPSPGNGTEYHPQQIHNEGSLGADELASRVESGDLPTTGGDPVVPDTLPEPTKIPVTYSESDPMVIRPGEKNYVVDKAEAEVRAGAEDSARNLSSLQKGIASDYIAQGDLEHASEFAEDAKHWEETAAREGEESGRQYREKGSEKLHTEQATSEKKVPDHEEWSKIAHRMSELADEINQMIERTDPSNQGQAHNTAQSNEQFITDQARVWSN